MVKWQDYRFKNICKKHDIKIGTIEDLISRRKNENLLVRSYEKSFNSPITGHGDNSL